MVRHAVISRTPEEVQRHCSLPLHTGAADQGRELLRDDQALPRLAVLPAEWPKKYADMLVHATSFRQIFRILLSSNCQNL